MSERLRPNDVWLLDQEIPSAPLHSANLCIIDPADTGFDFAMLVQLVTDRLDFVPRYRQRIQHILGRLAAPVWVDDDHFDVHYHVRRSAVPTPGEDEQLAELVGQILARRLDPRRPLWELYYIEGLSNGRVGILVKSHQVLVDGGVTLDLGQTLFNSTLPSASESEVAVAAWQAEEPPSDRSLILGAIAEGARSPRHARETAVTNIRWALHHVSHAGGDLLSQLPGASLLPRPAALTSARVSSDQTLPKAVSSERQVMWVTTAYKDHRKVRRAHGGTVNDVVVATVTGALRAWLLTRGISLSTGRRLKALLPMGVIDENLEPTSLGTQVVGHVVSLPIGESSPVIRLHQVSYALREHRETGRAASAERIAATPGLAPATFHALAARMASLEINAAPDLVLTNVPGPQFPLFLAGAEMVACRPIPVLLQEQGIAIAVTSYDGKMCYGITVDPEAIDDAEILAQCLRESLEELCESAQASRHRTPRGTNKSATGKKKRA